MLHAAEVIEVLPRVGGVRVRYRDLVQSGRGDFVRVLQGRMHSTGGAALWLPEEGELGVVGDVSGLFQVWMGSLPYQDASQVDPSPGILYVRHQSGLEIQVRKEGDFQLSHPSGFRLTVAQAAGALPGLKATSLPASSGDVGAPVLEIVHPSGAMVSIDRDGNGKIEGFQSLALQGGSKRFAMEGLADWIQGALGDWLKAHAHPVSGGSTLAPSTPPPVLAKDKALTPSSLVGPQG